MEGSMFSSHTKVGIFGLPSVSISALATHHLREGVGAGTGIRMPS